MQTVIYEVLFMQLMFLTAEVSQQVVSTGIDWNEIIYVVVGAVIGFIASIIVMVMERILDKKGKLNIFYRRINQKLANGLGWGFDESADGRLYFTLPVYFELQNTSNTTRVIRDLSFLLYSGSEFVGNMHQMGTIHITNRKGNEITQQKDYSFGSEKGSYSFVLPPRSIQRQECEYVFVINPDEKEQKHFDTVVARYYDERNKAHTFRAMDIDKCWERKHYDIDEDWLLLKEKMRIKKKQ